MAKPGPDREEPPELNPEGVRVLLRILLKAYRKQLGY